MSLVLNAQVKDVQILDKERHGLCNVLLFVFFHDLRCPSFEIV